MGRNWQPKHLCVCGKCGWKGKRAAVTKPCPKCGNRAMKRKN